MSVEIKFVEYDVLSVSFMKLSGDYTDYFDKIN